MHFRTIHPHIRIKYYRFSHIEDLEAFNALPIKPSLINSLSASIREQLSHSGL